MRLQAQYKIVPLSAYGKSYTYQAPPVNPNPGFSMTDAPQKVILDMDTSTYFNMMARLMGSAAPPAPEDAPMLARMAKIGLVPGQPFDMAKLPPAVQAALKDLGKAALQHIEANKNSLGAMVNGWVVTKGLGVYGTDYMKRAVVAAFGWPANLPQDAVYPVHRSRQRRAETLGSEPVHAHLREGSKRRRSTLSGRSRCMKSTRAGGSFPTP